jgi:phospholipase D1/2
VTPLADATTAAPVRRIPRRVLLRFLLLPALVIAGAVAARWTPLAGYLNEQAMTAAIGQLRHAWWAPALLVAGYVVLSPLGVPATPLMFAGGVVWGGAAGSFWNVLGLILGGAGNYLLGRTLGGEMVRHLAGRRLLKVQRALGRRGFWGLVAVRFLPLPYAVVNYGAVLAGVRPAMFLTTTIVGITPTVTLYTFFFAALAHAAAGRHAGLYIQLAASLALLLAVTLVPQILQGRRRRARLADLVSARAARAARPAPAAQS